MVFHDHVALFFAGQRGWHRAVGARGAHGLPHRRAGASDPGRPRPGPGVSSRAAASLTPPRRDVRRRPAHGRLNRRRAGRRKGAVEPAVGFLLTCPRWRSRPHRWPFRCRDGGRSIKHGRSCAYAHECQGHHRRGGTFDTVMPRPEVPRWQRRRGLLILVGYANQHGATAEIAERKAS